MTIYECNRCLKSWQHKSNYMRHINRKFPCKNKDIIESNVEEDDDNDKKICDTVNELVIEKNKMKVSIEEIKMENNKILSENNKIIKDNKKLIKKNKDLMNKVNILEKILTNHKNGNIYMDVENFVVNNGINIVEFGKEKWNFLTNEEKLKILDGGFKSVQRYVQLVHMNS
jgi:seryl-tRNA synthetase